LNRTQAEELFLGVVPGRKFHQNQGEHMQRKASAIWHGTLREGNGTISTESGVLKNAQYSFKTRFENGNGTNPEELIAAAHAGCYSMALGNQLSTANLPPESIETTAEVTLEKLDAGPTVTKIHLTTLAKVPGASKEAFNSAANDAKTNCPISRLLKAAEISLDAQLV
jgi:osmotically inducible protein OsmC